MTDKEFLIALREYIEDMEEKIEGEWTCRTLAQLIADREMPPVYGEVLRRLSEGE